MKNSKISWTTNTWNPVTGCTKISPGCDHCYAFTIAERMRGSAAFPHGFDLTLRPKKLKDPAKWSPGMVFVNSMSDLFHREIPEDYLRQIWDTMVAADQHQYQVLTKRPHRMAHVIEKLRLPLPSHIWLGVSVENQTFADNRIPALLSIPSPSRFLSCEPLLGSLDLWRYLPNIQWVIDGGESGAGRRPADYNWFRDLRRQCQVSGVLYYHKQGNHFWSGQDEFLDGQKWQAYPPAMANLTTPTNAWPHSGRMRQSCSQWQST